MERRDEARAEAQRTAAQWEAAPDDPESTTSKVLAFLENKPAHTRGELPGLAREAHERADVAERAVSFAARELEEAVVKYTAEILADLKPERTPMPQCRRMETTAGERAGLANAEPPLPGTAPCQATKRLTRVPEQGQYTV